MIILTIQILQQSALSAPLAENEQLFLTTEQEGDKDYNSDDTKGPLARIFVATDHLGGSKLLPEVKYNQCPPGFWCNNIRRDRQVFIQNGQKRHDRRQQQSSTNKRN